MNGVHPTRDLVSTDPMGSNGVGHLGQERSGNPVDPTFGVTLGRARRHRQSRWQGTLQISYSGATVTARSPRPSDRPQPSPVRR